MQVKKFEAPTIQEALETIKRELGPEAIILHTKKNRKGFGLMNNGSVEVTAAVSERAMTKKGLAEKKLPEEVRGKIQNLPADKQAEIYDKQLERHLARQAEATRDQVELGSRPSVKGAAARAASVAGVATKEGGARKVSATRYVDIDPEQRPVAAQAEGARSGMSQNPVGAEIPQAFRPRTPGGAGVGARNLEEEVAHLKRMLSEMKESQETVFAGASKPAGGVLGQGSLNTQALQDSFEQLTLSGLEKRLALQLLRKVGFELGVERSESPDEVLDQVAAELMSSTQVKSSFAHLEPKSKTGQVGAAEVLVLIGPTGVGKTTTIAKIASEAILRRNLKVGLINLDSYKVAAFDQLATYAKILNVPFRSAQSREDIQAALADFKSLDLVIVDTTGRSQRDPASLQEMKQLLSGIEGVRAQLVVSATTRDNELADIANRFESFKPEGIIVSKLDEATTYGSIYNLAQRVKLPLTYFTTGQRVPEDIEEATPERVAALILEL